MKTSLRVRHAAIAVLVLLGLLASSAAFALDCSIVCRCRTQCSTPCSDAGDPSTCGAYGICECAPFLTSGVRPAENPTVLSSESSKPDLLAVLLGTSCTALPAPSQAAAAGR